MCLKSRPTSFHRPWRLPSSSNSSRTLTVLVGDMDGEGDKEEVTEGPTCWTESTTTSGKKPPWRPNGTVGVPWWSSKSSVSITWHWWQHCTDGWAITAGSNGTAPHNKIGRAISFQFRVQQQQQQRKAGFVARVDTSALGQLLRPLRAVRQHHYRWRNTVSLPLPPLFRIPLFLYMGTQERPLEGRRVFLPPTHHRRRRVLATRLAYCRRRRPLLLCPVSQWTLSPMIHHISI